MTKLKLFRRIFRSLDTISVKSKHQNSSFEDSYSMFTIILKGIDFCVKVQLHKWVFYDACKWQKQGVGQYFWWCSCRNLKWMHHHQFQLLKVWQCKRGISSTTHQAFQAKSLLHVKLINLFVMMLTKKLFRWCTSRSCLAVLNFLVLPSVSNFTFTDCCPNQ